MSISFIKIDIESNMNELINRCVTVESFLADVKTSKWWWAEYIKPRK